jgi:hypothetical protein
MHYLLEIQDGVEATPLFPSTLRTLLSPSPWSMAGTRVRTWDLLCLPSACPRFLQMLKAVWQIILLLSLMRAASATGNSPRLLLMYEEEATRRATFCSDSSRTFQFLSFSSEMTCSVMCAPMSTRGSNSCKLSGSTPPTSSSTLSQFSSPVDTVIPLLGVGAR